MQMLVSILAIMTGLLGRWVRAGLPLGRGWAGQGRRLLLLGAGLLMCFWGLNRLFPLPPPKSFSTTILAADSSLLCAYLTPDEKWRMRSSPQRINPDMVKAIIEKEDKWFYYHPGINPVALMRALLNNTLTGRRTSGASTISMQLARMREPAPRTYLNKVREMFRALQYEWTYSKEEILELYLSYLPYGGNVEGVYAASYLFFDRPPDKLSLSQAILLSVIPNRPNSLRLDRQGEAARAARDKWIERFRQAGTFDEQELEAALLEPVPTQRHQIELKTPQFCYALKKSHGNRSEIVSSLRPAIQQKSQKLLAHHVQRFSRLGVSNGAVLVIDNRLSQVVAYCGSADFYDMAAQGQVDGVQGLRSPGSALKPLVYALAFERGLITPQMKLLDVPTTYYGFQPENYDLVFHGQVSVHFALSHSLNVPPVRLTKEMGLDVFLDALERSGFDHIKQQRKGLGLSAVLGGCGVTLMELTHFYSALARGGRLYPLYTTLPAPQAQPTTLFSEEAAFLVLDILSDIERPDIPQAYLEASSLPKVAWKTGTSYGHRDAWCVGMTPRYTVGVWMGNFDGHGVPEMSGTQMAVPLMLDIVNAIDRQSGKQWFAPPPGLQQRRVCSESGLPPSPHCTHTQPDWYIAHASPLRTCDLHQPLYVSADTSLQYCPACLPDTGYQRLYFPNYEPELALWFELNQVGVRQPPPHNPLCEARFSGQGPNILSPSADFEYLLERRRGQELLLQAASDPSIHQHHWYVNGQYLGAVAPGEKLFYSPRSSKLNIVCMDDKGRKSKTDIKVVFF